MSHQNSKKNSFRQTSITRNKPGFKIHKVQSENIKSLKKLPLIKQRKCSSTKNLIVSNTCEVNPFFQQSKNCYLTKFRKKLNKRGVEKFLNTQSNAEQGKYFFHKKQLKTLQFDAGQLKKYSSCNKLTSFPSIPEIQIPNDQSFMGNQNMQPQRQIKSSNSIKLQAAQYMKKPRLDRIPLKKILKNNMSKTINPRKIQSENSIQLQNEQKHLVIKKRSKVSKDHFDSKTKILVKNPFDKIQKRQAQNAQKLALQTFHNLQSQFRLSHIFEDGGNQSQISMSGKNDIEDLIELLN